MELEVTLARDLPVGPRGGVVKADTTVSLPATQAHELVYTGQARWPDKKTAGIQGAQPQTGENENKDGE